MIICLDESGDLGFGDGGSDHFVITFLTADDSTGINRAVRETKRRYRLSRNFEIKGSRTRARVKKHLLRELCKLDIGIHSIVAKKCNIHSRLREDKNILYNYILGLVLVPYVIKQEYVAIRVDRRPVAVKSGLKLEEYLKYKVWYESQADVEMDISYEDSKFDLGIQAVDVISYSIFRKYESRDISYYKLIGQRIRKEKKLFFKQ